MSRDHMDAARAQSHQNNAWFFDSNGNFVGPSDADMEYLLTLLEGILSGAIELDFSGGSEYLAATNMDPNFPEHGIDGNPYDII